eukprot:scaffold62529_cov30-Tisochrysis_lutea.AAC.1
MNKASGCRHPLRCSSLATANATNAPKEKPKSTKGPEDTRRLVSSTSDETRRPNSKAIRSRSRCSCASPRMMGSAARKPCPGSSTTRTSSHSGASCTHGSRLIATSATP